MKGIAIPLGAVLLLTACRVSIGGDAPIDQARLDETENSIRQLLAPQGTVLEVDMSRRDDDHMIGYANMRDANGRLGRFACTADRNTSTRTFDIRCIPPAGSVAPGQAAPAPAPEQGLQPAPDQGLQPAPEQAAPPAPDEDAPPAEQDDK